ncbi:MAG: universal stress protein A [Flavobacteriales bacterium]|jgi:universal stress protein A
MELIMNTYSNILVGLDLSAECDKILEKACTLADTCSAKIQAVHVVEPIAFAYGGDVPINLSEAQLIVEQNADKRLANLLTAKGLEALCSHICIGQPATELHCIAKEQDCDLIIVGSHGRHGLALLFGSTASGIVHGAKCDVLAIRV